MYVIAVYVARYISVLCCVMLCEDACVLIMFRGQYKP